MKRRRMTRWAGVLLAVLALAGGAGGCGSRAPSGPPLTWEDLLDELTNTLRLARLDEPGTTLSSSADPAEANKDYNHFLRPGPKGWVVLADLKGPGYLSRFWFTGAKDSRHRIRFYFDGERTPALDMSLAELCGGREPFLWPLAAYENFCWFNLYPMPFARRLVIMSEAPDDPARRKLFFQINHTATPGRRVESLPAALQRMDRRRLEAARAFWSGGLTVEGEDAASTASGRTVLEPGRTWTLDPIEGPGLIRRLSITPDFSARPTALSREAALREVVLRIAWDDADEPSVAVPLGDFFGSVWRRARYQSMFFGLTNDTFVSRFPMPFRGRARISLENQGTQPLPVGVTVGWDPWPDDASEWGYFHAAWHRSNPEEMGAPHRILRTEGDGKFVGCLLAVVGLDQNWWILESDEDMWLDGEDRASWRGTGLEDYFNGGWYYRNVMTRPIHGLPFKAFFRIVQYRLHLMDAPRFNRSFFMTFQRGPEQASRGWMESVAYYYLRSPAAAPSTLGAPERRVPPDDKLAQSTIMTELFNYERLGDYRGAIDYIDQFLETYPAFPFGPVLRLRQIACRERMLGYPAVRAEYERFLAEEQHPQALEQARLLTGFHESPSNVLAALYSNHRARLLLNGRVVAENEKPDRVEVRAATLPEGRNAVAVRLGFQPYPSWVQVAIRTHTGLIGSVPEWRYRFQPDGTWGAAGFDDSAWLPTGETGFKGPPEEPYIWTEPHAFVDVNSVPDGIRLDDEWWPDRRGFMVIRNEFDLPARGTDP